MSTEVKFDSDEQKVSYGIGLQMGEQLLNNPFEGMAIEAVLSGLSDCLNGAEIQVPETELEKAFQVISERQRALAEEAGAGQAAEGEAFLKENAAKAGIQTTESGLQYEIITEGSGDKPSASSTVRTHYHGMLINGSVFDSSVDRGEPAEFPVNGVIPGWTEALQLMPVGSKWKLFLPHQLAYGERGAGGMIGPYSTLVFEVELLAIL